MTRKVTYCCAKMILAIQLLFFIQTCVFANDNTYGREKDSLLTLLEISPERVKSKIYCELSKMDMDTDTSSAKAYAVKALEYANMYRARFDVARSHYQLGSILFLQDSMSLALTHLRKSLEVSKEYMGKNETGRAYQSLFAKALYYKAGIYRQLYPDSSKIILTDLLMSLETLEGSNDNKMLADINQLLGWQYFEINMYPEGLEHFYKAIDYYKIIGDKHTMALIYAEIVYRVDRATSIKYAQKAIELFAETGDSLGMARNLINISYNTRNILDSETNIGYLQLAYDIYEKHENYPGMAYALFHLATYHSSQLGDSAAALGYLKKGAEICLEHHVVKSAGHIYITLGTFYKRRKQYDSAAYYLHIADSITAFLPGKPERIRYFIRMGDLLNALERYDEAEDYLMTALEQSQKIDDWQLTHIAFHTLYRTFKNKGDFEKALIFFEEHSDIQNRMINQSTESKIAELQIRYETEKMQHQLEVVKKDRELKEQLLRKRDIAIASVSSGLLLILVFSGAIVRQYIKKRNAYSKLMEKNLQLLKCENSNTLKKNPKNNQQLSIDPGLQAQIINKLNYQIKQKKVFLKDDLTLTTLAKKCQTNSSYLSKIIHQKYDTNFSGFINGLRIKEAQKLMADKNYSTYSIEGIATSVGFKTKSVFNAAFKKFTGVTPSYYLEYLDKTNAAAIAK